MIEPMVSVKSLSYYISQQNFHVGNISYNTDIIISEIEKAEAQKADIVIFPELALSGYPPRDLLLFKSFHNQLKDAIDQIIVKTNTAHVIVGVPVYDDQNRLRNAAMVLNSSGIIYTYYKTLLPDYDVFDESRYFYPDETSSIVEIKGVKIGLQICEDAWDHLWMHGTRVTSEQVQNGAEIIINISASPYTITKPMNRLNLVKNHVKENKVPFIYVNLHGCQDDLVFDGRSFVVDENGVLVYNLASFQSDTGIISHETWSNQIKMEDYVNGENQEIYQAIILNLKDYLTKSGLPSKLLIAVSGGIDSALTLTLMANSVPTEDITAVYLPTEFSSNQSYNDAKQLCENLGVDFITFEIEEIRRIFNDKLHSLDIIDNHWSVADENIQARIRANIMMYLSNKLGTLLISTGNKSEIATGYCTLYGDTAGGKNLIGDLLKTQVYQLSRWINREKEIIPKTIIERPPTAELKENQFDSDSLPDYKILDEILAKFINHYLSTDEIVEMGYDRKTVEKIINLVIRNEFKRDQLVQTVKISVKAFGPGRKFPIASKFQP